MGNWTASRSRGDGAIYDAWVQQGKLLRTAFLADYFVNASCRELRRVLNRGEAVNALKRAIYTGRVGPAQAGRADEMQAVADALSLLANIVMAWNTTQMQAVLDLWANRRQILPPKPSQSGERGGDGPASALIWASCTRAARRPASHEYGIARASHRLTCRSRASSISITC